MFIQKSVEARELILIGEKVKAVNSQIEAYLNEPEKLKYNIIELIKIITSEIETDSYGEALDIGCAAGALVRNLSIQLNKFNFTGFDISEDLIEFANKYKENDRSNFLVGDFNSIEFDKKFDLITAAGVLSIFQDLSPLEKWLSWLEDDGVLFIFGRFNSRDIDTQILFRNNKIEPAIWEGGLTSFSIETVAKHLKKLGYESKFQKFNLPIEIEEDLSNPIRTFTKITENGEKIIMDGANIIAEHYFVTVRRHREN